MPEDKLNKSSVSAIRNQPKDVKKSDLLPHLTKVLAGGLAHRKFCL